MPFVRESSVRAYVISRVCTCTERVYVMYVCEKSVIPDRKRNTHAVNANVSFSRD